MALHILWNDYAYGYVFSLYIVGWFVASLSWCHSQPKTHFFGCYSYALWRDTKSKITHHGFVITVFAVRRFRIVTWTQYLDEWRARWPTVLDRTIRQNQYKLEVLTQWNQNKPCIWLYWRAALHSGSNPRHSSMFQPNIFVDAIVFQWYYVVFGNV